MIEKNVEKTAISTQILDALRDGYAGDHEKALNDCPFSEQAIAYAFEELTPDVQQTMQAHLDNCRACMDLILDVRTAQIESQKLAQNPPKVWPALSDAIRQSAQPSFIKKIIDGTFMTLRIIAAPVAVVCFMIVISRLNVLDGVNFAVKKMEATDRSQTIQNRVSPLPALEKKQADQPTAATRKDPAIVSSFLTHENWSTDPFEPAFRNKPRAVHKKSKPSSPLEALDPGQLKLVGVMLSDRGNKALVEDASGKGYMINEGSHIGLNAGKVSQILKDRVIIEEKIEDVYGKIRTQKRILKLSKP